MIARTLDAFFERHKGARRLALLWAMALITYATHAVFSDLGAVTAPVASTYGIVVGLLSAVIAFYQWSRAQDDLACRDR